MTPFCIHFRFDEDSDEAPYFCILDAQSCSGESRDCHNRQYTTETKEHLKKLTELSEEAGLYDMVLQKKMAEDLNGRL